MKKMYIDQIHTGLNTLALSMDAQWFGMNRKDATEAQRNACEGLYQGYIASICMMGGDWKRDQNGKHRIFLAGLSSRDADEYNEEG